MYSSVPSPSWSQRSSSFTWSFTGTFPATWGISLLRMIATSVDSVPLVQAQSQTHSSRDDKTMAGWRGFNDHTCSQEWTLAGGVPNVHDLNAHRIHRTISTLKEFDPIGFRPRVRAAGPAGLAYAPAASHEAMSARPNAVAWWPLKDICESWR